MTSSSKKAYASPLCRLCLACPRLCVPLPCSQVGYDPLYGARPVKRALQRELQTLLAKALLRGDFIEDDTVLVTAQP